MSAETIPGEADIAADLQRAASYRYLSLLFTPPTTETGDELVALASVVHPALRDDALPLGRATTGRLQGLYHQLLGASGRVPDVECSYDHNSAAGRGPLLADVAGFYRAFSFESPGGVTPDHVSAQLGFLGWLAMKQAYARHEGDDEHRAVTEAARARFVEDHLGRYVLAFAERLAQAGEGTHYENVGTILARTVRALEGEAALSPPSRQKHLPVLDDPPDPDACG